MNTSINDSTTNEIWIFAYNGARELLSRNFKSDNSISAEKFEKFKGWRGLEGI